jgi:Ca-activated chloride channel family protein
MTFRLASPYLLLLLALLPLTIFLYRRKLRQGTFATFKYSGLPFADGIPKSWRVRARSSLFPLRLLSLILVIFSLARPQAVQGKEMITGEGVDIALALDISGSMASLDFEPNNRLEAAKEVIEDFIQAREYDRIGMVVFSNEAYSQSPLTLDHSMLFRSLEQVELATDMGLEDGTAIGLGIANAANMLANSEAESKVVILLTDGVNNAGQIDPLTAAEAAKALGIRIYTIGAGHPGQVPVPVENIFGNTQIMYQESVLDESTLQQVATITGGKYYRATETSGLKAIYAEINQLERSKVEVEVFNQYRELFGLFLMPAIGIFLLEFVLNKTLLRTLP